MKGGKTPIHIMRWAPADYVNDPFVRLLIADEDFATLAFYHLVLNWSHMEGGDLSADPRQLAASLGMRRHRVVRSLQVCLDAGKLVVEHGRLCHPRVVREVREELAYRAEQALLGKKGGETAGRGRPKASIGLPLIEDRATPTVSIGPPSPAPIPLSPPTASVAVAPASPAPVVSVKASVVHAPVGPLTKPVPASRETWLTPFGDDWTEAYGGTPPWGEMAKVMKRPVGELGAGEVRSRWRLYLGQIDGRYASPTRFAQTVGIWTHEAVARMQPRDMRSMTVGDFNAATYERILKRMGEGGHGGQGALAAGLAGARGLLPEPTE